MAVLAACGVPPSLASTRSEGSSQRESFRRFIHTTIQPASKMVAEELSRKLDQQISLSFESLFASDLAGRARAFRSMVEAGLTLERAAALTGLMLDE